MIEWVAALRALVVNAAVLPLTVTGLPRLVEPSLNWTVPAAAGETVAVKVTESPTVLGLVGAAMSVVVVAVAVLTV